MLYAFADFTLDTDRYELRQGARILSIRPKAFELLRYLLEQPGRVAGKDELLSAVWPETIVTDDSLKQCVSDLRSGMGDSGAALLRTIPRRGYMLETDVRRLPGPAPDMAPRPNRLALAGAGAVLCLAAASVLLGGPRPAPPDVMPRLLLDGSRTVLGQEISYPAGAPRMVATVKYLHPGSVSDWHVHDRPLLAYVLRGTVVVDYGARGQRSYAEGEAILEALDWPHQARNEGKSEVEILVVELLSQETDASRPAPGTALADAPRE